MTNIKTLICKHCPSLIDEMIVTTHSKIKWDQMEPKFRKAAEYAYWSIAMQSGKGKPSRHCCNRDRGCEAAFCTDCWTRHHKTCEFAPDFNS